MRAIVLTFDRLPAHFLSCLGNEWVETPAFDRLAAKSRVFEQHFAEIPDQAGPAHPWWRGTCEFFNAADRDTTSPLQHLRIAGVRSCLLAEQLEGLPTELFEESEQFDGTDGLQVAPDQTPIARLVQAAIERLRQPASDENSVLWLHSRGVPDPWLAPRAFAELYLDELAPEPEEPQDEDADFPPPPSTESTLSDVAMQWLDQCSEDADIASVVLSERLFNVLDDEEDGDASNDESADDASDALATPAADEDPEMAQMLRRISKLVFGGYVSLLDHWLGRLIAEIEVRAEPTLLIVTAAMGQAFGEREDISVQTEHALAPQDLQDAIVRTPLIVWRSDSKSFGSRHQELHLPQDVPTTLLDWFGIAPQGPISGLSLLQDPGHSHALSLSPNGAVGIRDPHWLLVADSAAGFAPSATAAELADSTDSLKLYVKPSDQWNVFDVSAQEPDEVARLTDLLRASLTQS